MKLTCVASLIAVALLCNVPAAAAQERQVGAKAGPTFASLKVDTPEDTGYDTRWAVAIGAFVVLPANERFALQLEALFHPKGGKAEIEDGITSTYKFDYFEVPVLARLTASRSASRAFYIFAGPAAGLRVGAQHEFSAAGGGFNSGYSDDIGRDVERFELSAVAGVGADIGRHLVVDARYTWGLTDVNTDTTEGAIRNRSLTILAGYRF